MRPTSTSSTPTTWLDLLVNALRKTQDDYVLFPPPLKEHGMDTEELFAGDQYIKSMEQAPFGVQPVHQSMDQWRAMMTRANYWLEENISVTKQPVKLDEIALMFEDEAQVLEYITWAVREQDVHLFNSAFDSVVTTPIDSSYLVRYWFLRTPLPMRMECMVVMKGHSPLHWNLEYGGMTARPDLPQPVHLSFKVGADQYDEVCEEMVAAGAELVQGCESTYGRFSYYRIPGHDLYIKPRCNTRDQVKPGPSMHSSGTATELPEHDRPVGSEFGAPGMGARSGIGRMFGKGSRIITDSPQA